MSTTDPDATAVLEAVPAEAEPETEAPEVAEVKPGTGAEQHEPALDEAAERVAGGLDVPAFKGRLTIDQAILNRFTEWRYLAVPSLPVRPPTPAELAVYAARLDAPEWAQIYRPGPLLLSGSRHSRTP